MRGVRCDQCAKVIRTDVEPIFYRPAPPRADADDLVPVGLHPRCEDAYNNEPAAGQDA
jgi:hypothetical protein